MATERVFLGLDRPAIEVAADWLLQRLPSSNGIDLSGYLVVMPGRRAERLLQRALIRRAREQQLLLVPPRIVTVGDLPEFLYSTKIPFAPSWLVPWMWGSALSQVSIRARSQLFGPSSTVSRSEQLVEDNAMGRWLATLHDDVTSEGLRFSDVQSEVAPSESSQKAQWDALAEIERAYEAALASVRCSDSSEVPGCQDRQLARLQAITTHSCHYSGPVVLVGTADLSLLPRQMLRAAGAQVSALIYAPLAWQDRFDDDGCLNPSAWEGAPVTIAQSQWSLAENPSTAIDHTAELLLRLRSEKPSLEISVGCPESTLIPWIEFGFTRRGLSTHSGIGKRVNQTAPVEFLRDLAEFLPRRDCRSFSSLIRHPAWECWLRKRGMPDAWLSELDAYIAEHLPLQFAKGSIPIAKAESVQLLNQLVMSELRPFERDDLPLQQWCDPVIQLLENVFESPVDDTANAVMRPHDEGATLALIFEGLRQFQQTSSVLSQVVDGPTALTILIDFLGDQALSPAPSKPNSVNVLGWLELLMDTAAAVLVVGLNEGILPTVVASEIAFPERVQSKIGRCNSQQRLARDTYLLAALLESRAVCHFEVLRTRTDGTPLRPSRLLFSGDPNELLPKWRRFISDNSASPKVPSQVAAPTPLSSAIPRPPNGPHPLDEIRVTAFRTYLECPYRFWLQHIQKLEASDDAATEMNSFAFGNLAHAVLEQFGRSRGKNESSADRIASRLCDLLTQQVASQFGEEPGVAVKIQVEQLEARLRAFAATQAEFIRQGWRIHLIEQPPSSCVVHLPGVEPPLRLRGRIDRIDIHEATGAWRVLDYKTSARAKTPRKAHMKAGEWIDLQLPLYRHFAQSMGGPHEVSFGYLNLPQNTSETGLSLADWSSSELDSADTMAAEIIQKIRNGEFWPPADLGFGSHDAWADICLVGVRGI